MKWLVGILLGLVVLIGGLFVVFKFVVSPKTGATGTPSAPPPPAKPTAASHVGESLAQTAVTEGLRAAPALINAFAGIFGGGDTASADV